MTTPPMRVNLVKAPFPWPGGKSDAAGTVWRLLGDVPHYVEPFAGTLAVLLRRPHPANRTYYSETVNDADGLLVNFWRAIQLQPDATAEAASWPVTEADKAARSCSVLARGRDLDLERLMGDPDWCDPQLAGWWAWCVCVTIGHFGAGGPWWPDETGRLRRYSAGEPRPGGVSRELPHLGDNGRGVNRPQLREPGVSRGLPHLGSDGRGVNHAGVREPGVSRGLPHLGDDGRGVNHAGVREPGVALTGGDYHPLVMPQLTAWFQYLSARLRHVRVMNGDWTRAVGTGAAHPLAVRQGKGPAGVLLDPPYDADTADSYRDGLDDRGVAAAVARWAVSVGGNKLWRIVACGYDGDNVHDIYTDAGWTTIAWHTDGYLTGGYGNQSHRELLYASPHCLPLDGATQPDLFAEVAP